MKMFLHHFNKIIVMNGNAEKPVAGGEYVTYADFALFHVLDATLYQFDTEYYLYAWENLNVPMLKQYYEWMKSRPNLRLYFASIDCPGKSHFLCLLNSSIS
jgi:glutathione S-transferase